MKTRFDITQLFVSYLTAKGLPFLAPVVDTSVAASATYDELPAYNVADEEYTFKGSVLRKKSALGQWIFMPVSIIYDGKTYEMPYAILKISSNKSIVSTALAGGKSGVVNELISNNGYRVSISTMLVGDDNTWPEDDIEFVRSIYALE